MVVTQSSVEKKSQSLSLIDKSLRQAGAIDVTDPIVDCSGILKLAAAWWNALPATAYTAPDQIKGTVPNAVRASVVLFDVVDRGSDFRITLIGDRVSEFTRPGKPGRLVSDLFGRIGESTVANALSTAHTSRLPHLARINYVGPHPGIAYVANLVLPLSDVDGSVRQILSIIDFIPIASHGGEPTSEKNEKAGPGLATALPRRAGLVALLLLVTFVGAAAAVHGALLSWYDERLARREIKLERSLQVTFDGLERAAQKLGDLVVDVGPITPSRFNDIADALVRDDYVTSAVLAASLMPAMPADADAAFSDLANLMMPELGGAVDPWPETSHGIRYPVLYSWPVIGDRRLLGRDLWTYESRRAAAQRSLQTGRPIVSAPMALAEIGQEFDGTPPISAMVVQDAPGVVTVAAADGAEVLQTNALVAISVTLDQAIADGLRADLDGLEVVVLDRGPVLEGANNGAPVADAVEGVPLMVYPPGIEVTAIRAPDWTSQMTFAGRHIELRGRNVDAADRNLPILVAGALLMLGAVLSATAGLSLRQVETRRYDLEREVEARTRQIRFLNRDLINRVNHAISADVAKSRLLASLSHELRTPLNGIIGFTDLLRQRFDALSEDRRHKYLDHVAEAGGHMQHVVTRFLELSQGTPRIDSLRFERLALAPFGITLAAIVEPLAARYDVVLHVDLAVDPPVAVRADAVALRQCLLNFIDNAIKFTPAGGSVTVTATRTNAGLTIAVVDTGVGMSATQQANLGSARTDDRGQPVNGGIGLGLGLTLSRGLLAMMDYELTLDSDEGRGTRVEVLVPGDAVYPITGSENA